MALYVVADSQQYLVDQSLLPLGNPVLHQYLKLLRTLLAKEVTNITAQQAG